MRLKGLQLIACYLEEECQRIVQKGMALEYGLENPYMPREMLREIEEKRAGWCDEEIWEYMYVPTAKTLQK